MGINELTDDARITRIYRKFNSETGGTIEDFADKTVRSALPEWGALCELRFEAALARLRIRIDDHLSMPVEVEANSPLPPLDENLANRLRPIGMDTITPIVRLNTCYNRSQAPSLYAFAYETDRMALGNWGIKSEKQFIEALTKYVSGNTGSVRQIENPRSAHGLDQNMSAFQKLDDQTLRHFYLSYFRDIIESIQTKGRDKMLVSQIAAEINLKWPDRHRSRQLKEFFFKDKNQIFCTRSLGKKKVRTIILCLIWAAKESKRDINKFRDMSPDELMKASPLSAKEKQALTLRFLGQEPMTLEEVARVMNVTRERIRQHEKAAETKLRTLGINQFARDWLRRNSSNIWALLSDDDGATVEPKRLKGGIRRCVPGEVLLSTLLAGWTLDDVLSLEGDPIDDWWMKKGKD